MSKPLPVGDNTVELQYTRKPPGQPQAFEEGSTITPRVAIDNPSKVKNIVLMGAAANNTRDLVYFREVTVPLLYAQKVLDRNNTGLISISEGIVDPIFNFLTRNFTMLLNTLTTNESNIQLNSHKQQNDG